MSDASSRKTQLIAWLLACVLTGVIGFMISWARADRAEQRIRELAAENEALRAENEALRTDVGKLETPERFDIANNERAALAALRSILTAAMVYQAESTGGFPESLEALGPNGANILDEAPGGRSAIGVCVHIRAGEDR